MNMERTKNLVLRTLFLCMATLFALDISAQTDIKGRVNDASGEPVIGAGIVVKGTQSRAVTDIDGNFSINCRPGATLVFSYLGYSDKEASAQNGMVVTLEEDNQALDEVVVIGYGSVKKSDATGAVMTFNADPKLKGVAPNANDLLVGKMAGVSVVTGGGAATDGASIRIRGGSSLSASNDPLIILDGVYLDNSGIGGVGNMLSTIDPNDIESFTVLKDASATAIYGSRASNGVIIITTKKGKTGKIKVSYDGNISIATRKKGIDVMDGDEFRDFVKATFAGLSNEAEVVGKLGDADTDWQKEIFRTAVSTEHNVSVYGSVKDVLPFRVSLGYTNNNGILKTDKMERYTGSFILSPSFFNDHLKVNLNGKAMSVKSNFANRGAIGAAVSMDPTHPVYDPDSKYHGYWTWTGADGNLLGVATKNPVSMIEAYDDHSDAFNFIGAAQFEYNAFYVPGLKVNMNMSIDYSDSDGRTTAPYDAPAYATSLGYDNSWKQTRRNTMFEIYGTYAHDFKEIKSHFDIMGGYSWQHYWQKNDYTRIAEFEYDGEGNLQPKETAISSNLSKTEHYIVSFFGRMNYSYDDKYLLTFTLRDDGSSRFAKGNKWGLFPSAALAWRVIEEDFMKDQKVFSNLKLRLGWGLTGQQDINQGDYPHLGSYSFNVNNASSYYRNGQWILLLQPNASNSNVKWETTRTYNIGLDFGFLRNRINGSAEWYHRKTYNLINAEAKTASGTTFAEYVVANIGSLENRGFEFTLNTIPVQTKDWTWELNGNIAFNKSKILKLNNGDAATSMRRFESTGGDGGFQLKAHAVGHEAGMYYVYEQIYDTNGNPIEGCYADRNGDGQINEDDLYLYHSADPKVIFGLSTKLQYKNWDFSIAGHGAAGNYNYNAVAANNAEISPARIYANEFLTNRVMSAFDTNFQTKKVLSDYYVQDASFFRIDNITLGYSFANLFNKKINGRVYGTVQNPFVITSYDGLDPEVGGGIDSNFYPRPLTVMFGLNLNF